MSSDRVNLGRLRYQNDNEVNPGSAGNSRDRPRCLLLEQNLPIRTIEHKIEKLPDVKEMQVMRPRNIHRYGQRINEPRSQVAVSFHNYITKSD